MELVEGTSMSEYLSRLSEKKYKLKEGQIWRLMIEMCAALRLLHVDKKIIHRDFTPSNIMITRDMHVKITDFGLAKKLSLLASANAKSVVGTILYLSPEVV